MTGFLTGVAVTVVGGIILWVMGIGRGVSVSVHGSQSKKTGKWMIIIAWMMIISGLYIGGQYALPRGGWDLHNPNTAYGIALLTLGGILLFIGSIVAWFQKH